VIDAFCSFLGIQCFTIPPSKYIENILPTHVGSDDEQEVEALLVNEQSIPQEQEYRTF
jgi:ethanolaminephosphotransferase